MHVSSTLLLGATLVAAAVLPGVENDTAATPDLLDARTIRPPPACHYPQHYIVKSKSELELGSHVTLGSVTCPGNDGCTLTHGNTYSVTVGYTIGGSLGIDLEDIYETAGLDASYTYSTTQGTVTSVNEKCPHGPWTCAAKIIPYVKKVSGTTYKVASPGCASPGTHYGTEHFSVQYPQVTDGQPDVDVKICACPNLPHAQDKGAPALCPMNC